MTGDRSWEAVLDPGKATDFFALAGSRPAFPASPAADGAAGFDLGQAWWCSEISRTIYRQDDRQPFLAPVGLREQRFFDVDGTEAAVIRADAVAVLVFRGTADLRDWWTNVQIAPTNWAPGGRVHDGFASALAKVWDDVVAELERVRLPVIVTGHSLGGALATLAASLHPFAAAYTFGAPRVGDAAFWPSLRCPLHRVVNARDIVPTLPPMRLGYAHGGVLHHLAPDGSWHGDHDPDAAAAARAAAERSLRDRRWYEPHDTLSDHAPVNYSTKLAHRL